MKSENRYNFGHAVRQRDIEENFVNGELPEVPVTNPSPADSFLKIVYALDPITHLPTGDLTYMVSNKVNPEIKQWVLDNILIDVSGAAAPAPPAGLSDADIAALARDPHESPQDYMNRVNMFAQTNTQLYERLVSDAKSSNGLRKESVPSGTGTSSVADE